MRLFVASELAPGLIAALAQVSRELRTGVERLAPRARLTWIPPERMHLTIRFIGEVGEPAAARIRDALAPPLAAAPFDVAVAEVGAFPPKGSPRVLWVGIGAGRGALVALEREVGARLEGAGIPREPRPFSPHLTLARVRDAAGLKAAALLAGQKAPPRTSSRIDAITLFESRLSPQGPSYVPILRTPLRG